MLSGTAGQFLLEQHRPRWSSSGKRQTRSCPVFDHENRASASPPRPRWQSFRPPANTVFSPVGGSYSGCPVRPECSTRIQHGCSLGHVPPLPLPQTGRGVREIDAASSGRYLHIGVKGSGPCRLWSSRHRCPTSQPLRSKSQAGPAIRRRALQKACHCRSNSIPMGRAVGLTKTNECPRGLRTRRIFTYPWVRHITSPSGPIIRILRPLRPTRSMISSAVQPSLCCVVWRYSPDLWSVLPRDGGRHTARTPDIASAASRPLPSKEELVFFHW